MPPQKSVAAATVEIDALAAAEAAQVADSRSWQIECSGLNARLATMLERGLWTDCELLIGTEAVRFVGHRALLAGASPVFAAMLYGPRAPPSLNVPFTLLNVEPETFKLVLEYIYTDYTSINSCELACNLYKAAQYFILPLLKAKCKTYLMNNVTPMNVLHVFEFSEVYEDSDIKEKCLEIMTEETEAVLVGPGLEAASSHTLEQLFALPELAINSELELVKAADRWVRARPKIKKPVLEDPNGELIVSISNNRPASAVKNSNVDEDGSKALIRKALQKIRFLTISAKKFAEYDTSHLLNESDLLAISFNLQSRKSCVPLPKDFCTSRERRRKETFTISLQEMSKFTDEVKVSKSSIKYSNRYYISRLLPWIFQLMYKREKLYWSISIVDPNWRTYNKVLCKACITVRLLRDGLNGSPLELRIAKVQFVKLKASPGSDNCCYIAAIPQLSLKDLMEPSNGYLQDDAITFEVKIVNELLSFDSV